MRTSGTALWQGFDLEWENTSHRLKNLGSNLDALSADDRGLTGVVRSRATVGKVPDRGAVRTRVGGIRSRNLHFVEGEATGSVEGWRGEKARFSGERVVVEVPGATVEGATAVLRGFDLGCTSHSAGIHPQGISIGLTDLRVEDGAVSFAPRAWVKANVSPDLLTGWRKGFAFDVRVLYTVISDAEASIHHRAEPCARVEHRRKERSEARVEHRGRGGYSHAAVGVRGFCWDQCHRGPFGRNGRFVRRLQAVVDRVDYDPETGSCAIEPRLWFSNDGMVPYPTRSEHRLWTTLIEYRDDRPALGSLTIEQPVANGLEQGATETPFRLGATVTGR